MLLYTISYEAHQRTALLPISKYPRLPCHLPADGGPTERPPIQTVSGRIRMYQPAQKPARKKLTNTSMMSQIRPQNTQPIEPPPAPILPTGNEEL